MTSCKRKLCEEHEEEVRKRDRRLYCICKQPDDPTRMMVQCDFCEEWFHPSCVSVDEDDINDEDSWHCPACIELMSNNPAMSKKGLLGFQGRVAPKEGWTDYFPIEDIDERVIIDNVKTKRHKVEGWTLFREGRVTALSSNHVKHLIYFRSQCQAAMRNQIYSIYICFKDKGRKMKWATCSCPAGIDGQCKHLVATLYLIIDFHHQEIERIPDVKTCTDKLQMWHVRKPISDEPLLFSDISFVKHDPERPIKRDLSASAKNHNPVPDFARNVTSDKLQKLVAMYDAAKQKLPVLETIRQNKFSPVCPRQQPDCELQSQLFDIMKTCRHDTDNTTSLDKDLREFYEGLVGITTNDALCIERSTRLQSKTAFWFEQRAYRLTASNFGTFCRLRSSSNPVKTFTQKQKFFTTKSVRHGINYEAQAVAMYIKTNSYLNCAAGLVINHTIPFLAASPDRLVLTSDNSLRLVEVKCPYTAFQRKTNLASQMKDKNFYLQLQNGIVTLKKTHNYFYQIQGQLNITGIDQCDLVVFVPPDDIVVVEIKRDKDFFREHMLPKLCDVYFNYLLPHFRAQF